MFELKPMARHILLACGSLASAVLAPYPAAAQQQAQQLDKVEITGTYIRRVEAEGPLPVQIITREELEKSGKTTVTEVLTTLTLVSSGTFTEALASGNSFAPATASISLRGLGVNTSLVLINGRRIANYGFAQNISEAFVDLNAIPIAAIERIEILKDGASAIYGSDAIAGVVNVILRKDFKGAELSALAGTTREGGGSEFRTSLAAGRGDLGKDKFNVMGVIDVFKRDELKATDRSYSRTANQESRGGFDFRSPSGNPGASIVGGVATPFPNCPPGNIVPDPAVPGNTCAYDFAPDNWLLPRTERIGLFVRGVWEATPSTQWFGEFGYSRNVSNQSAAPTPGAWTMPAASPFNPFGANALIRYRFVEAGPRLNEIQSDTWRAVAGVKFEAAGWDMESAINVGHNEVTNRGTNYLDNRNVTGIFAGTGVLATNPDGSQTPGNFVIPPGVYYNPFNPASNPQNVIDALKVATRREGESRIEGVDFKATRELFQVAGGPVGFAVGGDARREYLSDTPDPISRTFNVAGSGGTSSKGSRSSNSAFFEFSLPLVKGFDSQWALRYDNYSDFGTAVTPKLAASWRPMSGVLMRASVANGFRAPSLVEMFLGTSISFPSLRDTPRCTAYTNAFGAADPRTVAACTARQVRTSLAGNPALDAERSRNYSLGLVLEPARDLTVAIDWFSIDHRERVTSPTAGFLLNNAALFPPGTVNRHPQNPDDIAAGAPGALRGLVGDPDPTAVGIARSFFNATRQKVSGADLEARYRFNVPQVGRFNLATTFTYLHTFKRQANPGQPLSELIDSYEYPRLRNTTTLGMTRGSFEVTGSINYTASYDQFYGPSAGLPAARVKAWTTADLQVLYTGIRNWRIAFGGTNIFDRDPPFSDEDWQGYNTGDHSPRGAFYYVRATYRF